MTQLNLFEWADSKPSNVIDAIPALCRKAVMDVVYNVPRPKGGGDPIPLRRKVA